MTSEYVFDEGELVRNSVVAKIATTALDGKKIDRKKVPV